MLKKFLKEKRKEKKDKYLRDFPGGPVGKTPHSQCKGQGSIPGWGTRYLVRAATKSWQVATKKFTYRD